LRNIRPVIGIIISLLIMLLCLTQPVQTILTLPDNQKLVVGEDNEISLKLPRVLLNKINMQIDGASQNVFASYQDPPVMVSQESSGYRIKAIKPGQVNVSLKLLGYIPLKTIQIESLPPRRVIAGGHSIGVMLQSNGIMVVGHAAITTEDGKKVYPARDQGLEIGDLILAVDGNIVNNENDLARVIDAKNGQEVDLTVKRDHKTFQVTVKPVHCAETNRYRVGLYVRDGVVGVGTLTFCDPETNNYAALGHIIMDADTKQGIDVLKGKVVSASVQMIKPGKPGMPGEKIGVFQEDGMISGDIRKNCFYGIYGKMDKKISNPLSSYPLEVAYAHQVKTGPAQILTVLNGENIERFEVNIEKIYPHRNNGKNMVIKVTDPRLLSISGGIIQGMSGSPIIQNNKIVGAVTHVMLNDPQTGYGIFMDFMLKEMPENQGKDAIRQTATG